MTVQSPKSRPKPPGFSLRALTSFILLLLVKVLSNLLYKVDMRLIDTQEGDAWKDVRMVAILNHTSLYEPLFIGGAPPRFLYRIACKGVMPVAEKTMNRPLVGLFFRLLAYKPVSITRQRDHTWRAVLDQISQDALLLLLPEGRMKRATGLDSHGKPMTVRGGIADLLEVAGGGTLLLAYSGGLHHVQVPGQTLPRFFRTVRLRMERVDIESYRQERQAEADQQEITFKRAVIADLERRRDLYCPVEEGTSAVAPPQAS